MDIILRQTSRGWLLIIRDETGELMRGSFYETPEEALEVARVWLDA